MNVSRRIWARSQTRLESSEEQLSVGGEHFCWQLFGLDAVLEDYSNTMPWGPYGNTVKLQTLSFHKKEEVHTVFMYLQARFV